MSSLLSPLSLEQLLHRQIPLSQAMTVSALDVSEQSVQLAAPLAPNRNHRDTVFGGSASALALLAAWSLLHVRLQVAFPRASVVIQRHSMAYQRPIQGAFRARASLAQPDEWPRFLRLLARRGKARIAVVATLEYGGEQAGLFSGDFVALRGD